MPFFTPFRLRIISDLSVGLRKQAGLGSGKMISHEKLIMCLAGCATTKNIGTDLMDLKRDRQAADYDLNLNISAEQAKEQVDNAEDLLADIRSFGGPEKVVSELKAYLQTTFPGVQ